MAREPARVFEFGAFRLDLDRHALHRNGVPVPLTPKVFDTLGILLEHSGRVVHKDDLMKRLWPDTVVEESNLSQNIHVLRKALGTDDGGEHFIQTIPRVGYRFAVAVRYPTDEIEDVVVRRSIARKVVVEVEEDSGISTRSLAVLPFRLLTGDPSDEYLGIGLADALITRLANLRDIIVRIPREFASPCN